MVCAYLGTIKGEKLNEPESNPICQKKNNGPNPARMDSACRVPTGLQGSTVNHSHIRPHFSASEQTCVSLTAQINTEHFVLVYLLKMKSEVLRKHVI